MNKSISRRLDALLKIASERLPTRITFTFKSGNGITTDTANAWDDLRANQGDIVNITGGEYAKLLLVVAHSVPNRRITDFEQSD